MQSVWQKASLPRFPHLDDDAKTDVLIIGGGIAGILTAYFLHQSGVPYMLVEKDRICMENTVNTTAKITAQHGLIYSRLLQDSGVETAQKYLRANLAALDRYAQMSKTIACDFQRKDNYVYADDGSKLEKELRALEEIGYPAEFTETLPLPVKAAGAVKFPHQAQFDPIKFLSGIVGGLHIYENTCVREMAGNTAVTNRGKIVADKVICATHFPFINKHGGYFLKLYQDRSYVIALSDAPDVGGMYVDDASSGLSFRNHNGLLLLGGSGGRTGKDHGNWETLRRFAREHYPQAQEECFWAAQDCMSLDSVPYIGQYSRRTPGFYVETGFNKWGMTSSMLSAMLISDAILGRENEFAEVFDPSRSILKPQLLLNGFEAVANLLTPSKRRCPHMGCALKWNKTEHTWDCPCHGSRFSEDGAVLNNPANGDLRQ
ncbi:MAG: FAD-dependent oxidoreductase [Clostridiales bacterium]|nr:FAD-dependent oxidoreductase [Candidatus Cacconaster stercorequi]